MTKLLKGAEVAASMKEKLTAKVAELKEKGICPTLAIVRVGAGEDDLAYERGAIKRLEGIGAAAEVFALPEDVKEEDFLRLIRRLNTEDAYHGILVFRPLISEEKVSRILAPEKDVDGMSRENATGIFLGEKDVPVPCTPKGVLEILDHYGVELDGKNVTLIGRSLVVGKPLMMLLAARNATVRLCHTHTRDLKEACADADIVITAIGCAKAVPGDIFPEHAVVIDVGINTDAAGNLCGDVDYEVACDRVAAITPVPGGVGSVTTSALASNLIEAAQKMADRKTTSSGEGMPDLFYEAHSLADFAGELAGAGPVPGGGGASAYAGVLAAALCSMAGSLTLGKKKYEMVRTDIEKVIARTAEIRGDLLKAMQADAEGFYPLREAYAVPKEDPKREEILENASREASKAPFLMMERIAETITLLEEMQQKGSVMLRSDVACGASLAAAALTSASMNLYINTKGYDADWARDLVQKADDLLAEYLLRAEKISREIMETLR